MILYIAEKPSLGRAIADALPKPHKKQQGYIEVGGGDIVSWCIGHLLEQAEPDAYDPAYKQWKLEHLPIVPEQWQLKAKKETSKQLTVLRGLLKKADHIVHAGDPDREGQLLVDEVLSHLRLGKRKLAQTQRCLINDMNVSAVRKALANLRDNSEFIPLSVSALARSRADWLYGMNMTRLCTIHGGKAGYQGVLSVGRVQTPLLGLVVRRDIEIEQFEPKPFYQVWANVQGTPATADTQPFRLKWLPSESCAPYQDEEGRVLSRALAENVVKRITGQPGVITQAQTQSKQQAAPLPYNLSSLQIDAAKRFGMSAKQVLETCQSLYEKHKLITYPRSDSRYLPVEQLAQVSGVCAAIGEVESSLADAITKADLSLKSKAWNDSKVDAHHAIIPTQKSQASGQLTKNEQQIYQQIARQYLIQFYPPFRYDERQLTAEIAGGQFSASSKQTTDLGWKALMPQKKSATTDDEFSQTLPNIKKGDGIICNSADILDKMTSPPAYFSDATLLAAMTGINRFVQDKALKKVLKDTDGIGTEATRAGIIELLFNRKFLMREGKAIKSTAVGRKLIASLPEMATTPDMTAIWESRLSLMAKREFNYQVFMNDLQQVVVDLSAQLNTHAFSGLKGEGTKPNYKKGRSKSTKGRSKSSRSKVSTKKA